MSDKNNPVHVKKSDCHIFLSDLHKILAEFMSKFAETKELSAKSRELLEQIVSEAKVSGMTKEDFFAICGKMFEKQEEGKKW